MAFVTPLPLHRRTVISKRPFSFVSCRNPRYQYGLLRRQFPCMQTPPTPNPPDFTGRSIGDVNSQIQEAGPSESSYSSSPTLSPLKCPTTSSQSCPIGTSSDRHVPSLSRAQLKLDFYARAASLNRGLAASPAAREDIVRLICDLEHTNPTAAPASRADLLCGEWKLVFTNALDIVFLGLLAPIFLLSDVYQNIYPAASREKESDPAYNNSNKEDDEGSNYDYDVVNIVQIEPPFAPVTNAYFGRTSTTLTVKGIGCRASDNDNRLVLTFINAFIRQTDVFGWSLPRFIPPLRFSLGRPVGYIETTFLDEDLRVLRAPPVRGLPSLFVLRRESTSPPSSQFSNDIS